MLVWAIAGLLTLFGALSLAELSSVLPQAGGPYVYLRHSFGRLWAFLFSWNDFFINKAGSAAAIAMAFATYLGFFIPAISPGHVLYQQELSLLGYSFPFAIGWNQIVAMVAITIVTIVNVRGVRWGGWVMNVFTTAKVVALVGLVLAVALSSKGSVANFLPWWLDEWTAETTSAFGLAMISALWAYDGWIDVTLTAGEFKNPHRNVPRSLLIGTLLIIVLYVSANLAYAYVIPISQMPGSPRIAADVAQVVLGPIGASLIVAGIMCSTFGATNGMLLAGPRSIFAAGVDGTFAGSFGRVHSESRSPYVAITTLGIWGGILTLSGTYEQIISYVVFGSWTFYAMTAVSVIILRRRRPEAARPYRTWGYPYTTLLFVAIAIWFIINTLLEDTRNAIIGIFLLLMGLPFYFHWQRRGRRE
jgi:APA family basic amino acid/polyamine antiporter